MPDTAVDQTDAPLIPTSPEDWPDESAIITEDGKPVDSVYVEKQMRLLTEPLFANWQGPNSDGRFVAMANVGLFMGPQDPLVPDVLLSVDVVPPEAMFKKQVRSYFIWRFGKVPDVVIEIVSNKEGGEDSSKLVKYARWGIPNYVVYDPLQYLSDNTLRVFALEKGRYRPVQEPFFERVGLGLTLWKGTYEHWDELWLRWCDRHGDVINTGAEQVAIDRGELQSERERADTERQRADAERRKVEQLTALLKAKGIDPGAP